MHPSRQAMLAQSAPSSSLPPPRTQTATVQLRPLTTRAVAPLSFGDRREFNRIRIGLLTASSHFMRQRPSEEQTLLRVETWIDSPEQIAFDHMPFIQDTAEMSLLVSLGLLGVYWFVNHADTRGCLSCGQVFDLLTSLDKLSSHGLDRIWPSRLYDRLVTFLQACLDKSSGVAFDHVDAGAAAVAVDPSNLSNVLSSLQQFLPPVATTTSGDAYDPSQAYKAAAAPRRR